MRNLFALGLLLIASTLSAQVSPLLSSKWGQGCYYNDQVPIDPIGPCGQVLTGCNATALAQLMRYHEHPANGYGTTSYTSDYGELSAHIGSSIYDWSNMPDQLTSTDDPSDVAQLMYDLGVAVSMDYGTGVSNSSFNRGVAALKQHFRYSLHTQHVYTPQHSWEALEEIYQNELDAGGVIFVTSASHIFLIDGYRTDPDLEFHVNFGWSGTYDGYYPLNDIKANGGSDYSPHKAVIGIRPLTELEVSTELIEVPNSATEIHMTIAAVGPWSASESADWLSMDITGDRDGYFYPQLDMEPNLTFFDRTATITISDGTTTHEVEVTQKGIQPKLQVSDNDLLAGAEVGFSAIDVLSDSSWMVVSLSSWIVPSEESDSANSTLTLNLAENTDAGARNGSVLLQRGALTQVITVEQLGTGSELCTPVMNPPMEPATGITSVELAATTRLSAAGEGYVQIETPTVLYKDSTYTLTVDFQGWFAGGAWIDWNQNNFMGDVNDALVGEYEWYQTEGPQSVTFTVPSDAELGTTVLRIYGLNFFNGPAVTPCSETSDLSDGDIEDYFIQIKDASQPLLETDANALSFEAHPTAHLLLIVSDSTWTVTAGQAWISTDVSTGEAEGAVSVTVSEHASTLSRSGHLLLSRGDLQKIITIEQAGVAQELDIVPDTVWIGSVGQTLELAVDANVSFEAATAFSWIDLDGEAYESGQSVGLEIPTNPDNSIRQGLVMVSNGELLDTVVVIQDSTSTYLEVSPLSHVFTADGGTLIAEVLSFSSWVTYASDSWLEVDILEWSGSHSLTIDASPNPTAAMRSGSVTVSNGTASYTIRIDQEPGVTTVINQVNPSQMVLYPNPTTEKITLLLDQEQEVQLVDMHGSVLYRGRLPRGRTEVPVYNLANGQYTVRCGERVIPFVKR